MKKALLSMVAVAIASSAMITTANAAITLEPRPYASVDYKYLSDFGEQINKKLAFSENDYEYVYDAELDVYDEVVTERTYDKFVDKQANMLGVTFGVQLNDYVGVETTLAHTIKDFSDTKGLSAHLSTISLGVTGQYPINDQFYAKGLLGSTWGRIDAKIHTDDLSVKLYENTGASFLGKVGVGYQLNDSSTVEFTYDRELESDGLGLQYKVLF